MKFKAAFTICFVFGFFLKSFVPVAIAQNEMLYAGLAVAPPDTVPPDLSEFDDLFEEDSLATEAFESVEDESFCALINCDLYKAIWDTSRINPYCVDLRTKKDTTRLQLVYDPHCDYAHPVCGEITSEFGMRGYRHHYGIDINLETGDPVFSAFEGTVRVAKYSPTYGFYVILRHLNGLETLYAHLSEISVRTGDYLQAGDMLGLGGNTGRSRGSHLHFEIRFLGQQIDPRQVIAFEEFACKDAQLTITAESFNYLKKVEEHKAQQAKKRYYKIRKGDTLSKIARKNRTTVKKLCKLNRISAKTRLKPGRRLRVA
jgi:murein DD-endopeptidase MepM/ murein hydrolase activator NlpD